jgi:hypothetical protein
MATVEVKVDADVSLEDDGITLTLWVSDDIVDSISFDIDDLVGDLMDEIDKTDNEDRAYAEAVAEMLAEASQSIYCNLG